MEWEQIFSSYVTEEGLAFRIDKGRLQLNNQKAKNPVKMGVGSGLHFSREDVPMASEHVLRAISCWGNAN